MIDIALLRQKQTVANYQQRSQLTWWLMFMGLLGATGMISFLMIRGQPSWGTIAWLFYAVAAIAIFYQPRYGVYLLVGLTLVGDQGLISWYPFAKNFSSGESVMYVSNALIFSPLETFIVFTAVSWLGRMAMERRIRIYTGVLFWPAIFFISFVTFGLVYGLSRHGNINIALWETRSIYYLIVLLVFTSNLIRTHSHVNTLIWTIIVSLFLKGLAGTIYVAVELKWDMGLVEAIGEHAMSIHFNAFFILLIAVWLYHDSTLKRIIMPLMSPFVLLSFIANHRRAGFLTLGIAIGLILLLLYRENRKLFWIIAPSGTMLFLVYLAAFWNNSGSIGMIARAVRSVVGQPTERDESSNVYRDLEDINTMFNIDLSPLFGLGFGQKFYIVAPMPDISLAFEWWEYITHNSVMWIWMQAGVGAFFFMLLLVGSTLILGGRAIWDMSHGSLRAAALTSTLYVLMHFTFAYVDMSWNNMGSMVFVGTTMGLINCLHQVAAAPLPVPRRRWPWQVIPSSSHEQAIAVPIPSTRRRPRLASGMATARDVFHHRLSHQIAAMSLPKYSKQPDQK